MEPKGLIPYSTVGHFFVAFKDELPPPHTKYLVMRFDRAFSEQANQRLMEAWEHLVQVGYKASDKRKARSSGAAALHVGVWEKYSQKPMITSDSVDQSVEAIKALDNLLQIFKDHVLGRLNTNLYRHDCANWQRQQL